MIQRKHLIRIKKFIGASSEGINFAQNLLCDIAFREKLSPNFYNSEKAKQVFRGFRRYRFVRHIKKNSYILTLKGEKRLQDILIEEVKIKAPQKWDGKWHLVIYDLPIRFKKAREAFRHKLKNLGFLQFQKSAWIYPYSCEKEILFVANFFGVRKYMEILEINKVLDDRKLKAHFGL